MLEEQLSKSRECYLAGDVRSLAAQKAMPVVSGEGAWAEN